MKHFVRFLLLIALAVSFLTNPLPSFASLNTTTNFRVTRYADSDQTNIKYATLVWDPVPGAVTYNLYTVGTTDVFFDTAPTTMYTFKFNQTSSWYFKVAGVDKDGNEGSKSMTLSVEYPEGGTRVPTPQNIRISQIEKTADPSVRLVHIFWDPVPGATAYVVYSNAGSTYYYLTTVDTNLYEMKVNVTSTTYVAVSAVKDNLESARSSVLTIDIPKEAVPTELTAPTTPSPSVSNQEIQRLKQLEQDVKTLREDVVVQQERQSRLEQLLFKILDYLKGLFGLNI